MSQAATAVEGERIGRSGDPCVMVIFGASGDLTRRKLIPRSYNLAKYNLLSREFAVDRRGAQPDDHRRIPRQAGSRT